ncbi:MAG TPA: GNAT family N-acetyltransferase, partial [Aequorivita sp.]|nr:GNAT family N-acetyltransferase [Aequorivita sp.]
MNSFSVIQLGDNRWSEYVAAAHQYDFHHTSCYHQLEKEGEAMLFVAENKGVFVALPLILRKIENTQYWDCTSAYGYCGPISNLDFDSVSAELFAYFRKELLNYFKQNPIISAFSRLHPLIFVDELFAGFGKVIAINQTVSIDLRLPIDEQRRQFRKSNKSEINQLRGKKGYNVVEAKTEKELKAFVAIYHENMERVDASENYFFDYQYFYDFINNACFTAKLLLAMKDDEIAAGAIFTATNTIMQYHLAGTKRDYIHDTPMKLVLDEARLLGSEIGLHHLHLGGGVGGSDEDSLFRFKAGFSKERAMYRIWQHIVDQEKYEEVC